MNRFSSLFRKCRSPLLPVITISIIFLEGCWNGGLGYVQGVVKLDGSPVERATLEFCPTNGTPAYGVTTADGRYELASSATQKGLPPGEYKVRITTFGSLTNPDGSVQKISERFPARFNEKTEIMREVKPGTQYLDFDLTSK